MNVKHVLAFACAVAAAGLAQGAWAAQPQGAGLDRLHPATAEQARASSIQMLARSFGISQEEAASRLNVEKQAREVAAGIRERYADRLAGMYIEHTPAHRLVVRLTGNQPVLPDYHHFSNSRAGLDTLQVDYQVGAEHTFADLQQRFDQGFNGLKAQMAGLQSGYVDQRTGEIVLEVVTDPADAAGALRATARDTRALQQVLAHNQFGVATRVEPIGRIENQAIKGSGNLDATGVTCTGAFTVRNNAATPVYGLLTAGHCKTTTLNYTEVGTTTPITALSWIAEKNDASSDIGWASVSTTASDAALSFYDGSMFVPTGTPLSRSGTIVGQTMCHYGRSSISSASVCGTVQSTLYNPGSICGPSGIGVCSATFVAVNLPVAKGAQLSDSGGNWFIGDQPSGIHKAADPTVSGRSVYSSTDDISSLGLQILF